MKNIVIATRGSLLALWQAEYVKSKLLAEYPGLHVELLVLRTKGDKILDVPLAKIGGKGLFVKEIEDALLDGRAHLAVHSMKDVPTVLPEGLEVEIIPPRGDRTDSLLSVQYNSLNVLPEGSTVGTSSLRRGAQILALRPDLVIKTLRGNVNTRLDKLLKGEYHAIVMATAALKRLQLKVPAKSLLAPPDFLPAVAQGALGIEYRKDSPMKKILAFLDDKEAKIEVRAERGFLTGLDGGCQVPIAAFSKVKGSTVHLTGLLLHTDGTNPICKTISGPTDQAFDLGLNLARTVLEAGGDKILQAVYNSHV